MTQLSATYKAALYPGASYLVQLLLEKEFYQIITDNYINMNIYIYMMQLISKLSSQNKMN